LKGEGRERERGGEGGGKGGEPPPIHIPGYATD